MCLSECNHLFNSYVCIPRPDCYQRLPDDTFVEKNSTNQFQQLLKSTLDCIKLNRDNNTSVCANCVGDYDRLDHFYQQNVQRSAAISEGVCFDLRDAMNRTRRAWSHEFKCCRDRHESRLAFVVCSVVVATLPLMFYVVSVVQRRRADRHDDGPLIGGGGGDDEDDDVHTERRSIGDGGEAGRGPLDDDDDDDVRLIGDEPLPSTTSNELLVDLLGLETDRLSEEAAQRNGLDDSDADGDDVSKNKKALHTKA